MALTVLVIDKAVERCRAQAQAFSGSGHDAYVYGAGKTAKAPNWTQGKDLPSDLDAIILHNNNAALAQGLSRQIADAVASSKMSDLVVVRYTGATQIPARDSREIWIHRAIVDAASALTKSEASQIADWIVGMKAGMAASIQLPPILGGSPYEMALEVLYALYRCAPGLGSDEGIGLLPQFERSIVEYVCGRDAEGPQGWGVEAVSSMLIDADNEKGWNDIGCTQPRDLRSALNCLAGVREDSDRWRERLTELRNTLLSTGKPTLPDCTEVSA